MLNGSLYCGLFSLTTARTSITIEKFPAVNYFFVPAVASAKPSGTSLSTIFSSFDDNQPSKSLPSQINDFTHFVFPFFPSTKPDS
jgi:hypothetical protein